MSFHYQKTNPRKSCFYKGNCVSIHGGDFPRSRSKGAAGEHKETDLPKRVWKGGAMQNIGPTLSTSLFPDVMGTLHNNKEQ